MRLSLAAIGFLAGMVYGMRRMAKHYDEDNPSVRIYE